MEIYVVLIISSSDYSFGLLVFMSTVRETENSLKNWRIAAVYETSSIQDRSIFKTIIIWSIYLNNENCNS